MCKSRLLFVISIHAPTRGATFFVAFSLLLYLHFNPRSHEGSDGTDGGSRLNLPISIHAPTRGATTTKERYWIKSMISIHAPTRGATKVCTCKMFCNLNFNPRSHEGSDDKVCPVVLVCDISIHAPTRGATLFQSVKQGAISVISIHAPTRGATPSFSSCASILYC